MEHRDQVFQSDMTKSVCLTGNTRSGCFQNVGNPDWLPDTCLVSFIHFQGCYDESYKAVEGRGSGLGLWRGQGFRTGMLCFHQRSKWGRIEWLLLGKAGIFCQCAVLLGNRSTGLISSGNLWNRMQNLYERNFPRNTCFVYTGFSK